MTEPTALDEYVLRHAPGPTVALHPSLARARTALRTTVDALRAGVSDADMEFVWDWDGKETDVRYGFYRLYELMEVAAADAERAVGAAAYADARQSVAAGTAARWDLHGLLFGLRDDDLDADPGGGGGGEWTVRQTLGHIVSSQRFYSRVTAWWLSRRDAAEDDYPLRFPAEEAALMPTEEDESLGSLADISRRFDEAMDTGAARLAVLDPAEQAVRARWSGLQVSVGFRQWRWSSHIREHTIQVEKTLVMLRRDPTEVERLIRLVAAAYGRLEAKAYGLDADLVGRAGADGRSPASLFDEIAAALLEHASSVPVAARAKVPYTED